jgi:hypothetical protein
MEAAMADRNNAVPKARHLPARPDPKTGEVPAGPGDAGLQDRPELNAGSPGTKQMSSMRLAGGLGIAALLAILVFAFAAMFGFSS